MARYRSIYVNGVPVWECSRCGERRALSTHEEELTAHEAACRRPTRQES